MGVNSDGTVLLNEGSFTGLGSVSWDTTAKTANFTAVSGAGYFCNTASGTFTATLPAGSAGDIVAFSDYASTFDVPYNGGYTDPNVYAIANSDPYGSSTLGQDTLQGGVFSADIGPRSDNAMFAIPVAGFDSSDYGVLYEVGNSTRGFAMSLEAGGQLWVAAFVGSSWQASGQAYLKADVSSYYNTPGTFYVVIDRTGSGNLGLSQRQFNLYFQSGSFTDEAVLLGQSAGTATLNWFGTSTDGGVGTVSNGMVNFGFTNYDADYTGTINSVTALQYPEGYEFSIGAYGDYVIPSSFQTSTTPYVGGFLTVSPNGTDKINGTNGSTTLTTKGSAVSFLYVDSTIGWKLIESINSNVTGAGTFITATGGTITTCGDYKTHTFTGPGTFCVSAVNDGFITSSPNKVEYLVVAGGGSGGTDVVATPNTGTGAGGGGAGGVNFNYTPSAQYPCCSTIPNTPVGVATVSVQAYPVTVGAGAAGAPILNNKGSNGSDSSISGFDLTALAQPVANARGGGGGAGSYIFGSSGGSGGGGGDFDGGSTVFGNPGGESVAPGDLGSGGGGLASAGTDGTATAAGPGGNGRVINMGPPSIGAPGKYFGAGGGGGGSSGGTDGAGGTGGGTAGQVAISPTTATGNAPATSGSGSGALGCTAGSPCSLTSGNGGSGVVVIRYKYQ
jgi:hypothetical protein